jgi:hypothetical protein
MRFSKYSGNLIICLFALTVLMGVSPTPGEAFIIDGSKTGMIGITDGQTLRVNVANVGSGAAAFEPCIKVYDAMGHLLVELEGNRLPAGVAMSFDLNRDDIMDSRGRLELRVEIELEDPDETNARRLRDRTTQPEKQKCSGVILTNKYLPQAQKTQSFVSIDPRR